MSLVGQHAACDLYSAPDITADRHSIRVLPQKIAWSLGNQ